MAYFDVVSEVCNEANLDAYVYPSPDSSEGEMLQVTSWDELKKLNRLLKDKFSALGIDITEVEDSYHGEDDAYVCFATDDNYSYSDDSFVCDNCGNLYLTDDSYVNYFIDDYGFFCEDCVHSDDSIKSAYLCTLINDPDRANTLLDENELLDLDFLRVGDEYANGWYGRQDSPRQILNDILDEYPDAEVVFSVIKNRNPFETRFKTFIRYNEEL